jgi:HPt (histidine-containing phosphotransfer) domain-containing protein
VSEADAPVLDERVLSNLSSSVEDDRSFVVELIEAFLADGPDQLTAIDAARTEDDAEALVRPAHTLKSSSATVGALRLSSTARELEMVGRGGSLGQGIDEGIARLRADWQASVDALRAWVAGAGQ